MLLHTMICGNSVEYKSDSRERAFYLQGNESRVVRGECLSMVLSEKSVAGVLANT